MTGFAIVGCSMWTSLGPAPHAMAAARARLSRASPVGIQVTDGDAGTFDIAGHAVRTAWGYAGLGRRVALAIPALEGLVEQLPTLTTGRASMVWLAPGVRGLGPALTAAHAGGRWASVVCVPEAPDGLVHALSEVQAQLDAGIERVVLGVVDTAVDAPRLVELEAEGRLKGPSNPVGMMPGEAAVCFACVRREAADRPLAFIEHWASAADYGALALAGPAARWVFSPLNGEEPIAREWARLVVRWQLDHVWHLATSFGDTQAAHGALAMAWAIAAWQRRYAKADRALAVTAGPSGPRGGVWLSAPPQELDGHEQG